MLRRTASLALVVTAWAVTCAAGCATDDLVDDPADDAWLDGKADGATAVDLAAIDLDVDLSDLDATATIALEKNGNVALEVGGLTIDDVVDGRGHRRYKLVGGQLRVANVRGPLVVRYRFSTHAMADGLLPGGSTVVWPYFCGNLFPCHSRPADGVRFALHLDGVPAG